MMCPNGEGASTVAGATRQHGKGRGAMTKHRQDRQWKQQAQGLVEYGLILVLIMIAVVIVVAVLGNQINNLFSSITSGVGMAM